MRLNLPKTRNKSEVEVEHILQPLNGSGGLVGKHLNEVRPRLVTGGLEGVIVELLHAVLDAVLNLCPCEGAVDAGCGLCRVAAEEALLVEDNNVTAGEVDGVGSAEAGNWNTRSRSAKDNDDTRRECITLGFTYGRRQRR
jgi:hypothetical protein